MDKAIAEKKMSASIFHASESNQCDSSLRTPAITITTTSPLQARQTQQQTPQSHGGKTGRAGAREADQERHSRMRGKLLAIGTPLGEASYCDEGVKAKLRRALRSTSCSGHKRHNPEAHQGGKVDARGQEDNAGSLREVPGK